MKQRKLRRAGSRIRDKVFLNANQVRPQAFRFVEFCSCVDSGTVGTPMRLMVHIRNVLGSYPGRVYAFSWFSSVL